MNQYNIYERLKKDFINNGSRYDLEQVKTKFQKQGFSDDEIINGYVDFYFYSLPTLKETFE